MNLEKLEELEELISWNLSFGIYAEETLRFVNDISDEEKKELLSIFN